LIIAGQDSELAEALRQFARRDPGSAESCLVFSGDRISARLAALVHGALAHAWDFDDTFLDSIVHPGSVVIPTALSVGEAVGADGPTTGAAIAVGYEVAARLGSVAGRNLHARSFHASGIIGPLAAAATAGRLYGHTPQQMTDAFGLAASMSGGLLNFLNDGGWSKWLHLGWAAHGGITAAQLAADGFRGPAHVLEGPHGLYDAFTDKAHGSIDSITRDLGVTWMNSKAWAKHYPCAHVIAPYIDGALDIAGKQGLRGEDIAHVECGVEPWTIPIVCMPRASKLAPSTTIEAIASLPYHVAAALVISRADIDTLGSAARTDPKILDLAERVSHTQCAGNTDGVTGFIRITTTTNNQHEKTVAAVPVEASALRSKFRANAARYLNHETVAAVETSLASTMASPTSLWHLVAASD